MAFANNVHGGLVPGVEHKTYAGDRRQRAGEVMLAMNRVLRDLTAHGLECVVYEDTFMRGINASKALYGLVGVIEACCYSAGFTALWVPAVTVKKWATGSGKASKADMIATAQIMGYEGDNEHEADSFLLLKYAEANVIEGTPDDAETSGDNATPEAPARRGRKGIAGNPEEQPVVGSDPARDIRSSGSDFAANLADQGGDPGPDFS